MNYRGLPTSPEAQGGWQLAHSLAFALSSDAYRFCYIDSLSGLGKGAVLAFAELGANVVIADINLNAAEEVELITFAKTTQVISN